MFLISQFGVILIRTIRTVNFLAIALKTEKCKTRCMLNYCLNQNFYQEQIKRESTINYDKKSKEKNKKFSTMLL